MTRLDSVIRRLTAQRSLLDWASRAIDGKPGLVLELGLGNGRTYPAHLRSRLPGRDIYAFERSRQPSSTLPPADKLIVGDVFHTLPEFAQRFGLRSSILIHADGHEWTENEKMAMRVSRCWSRSSRRTAWSWAIAPSTCPDASISPREPASSRVGTSSTGAAGRRSASCRTITFPASNDALLRDPSIGAIPKVESTFGSDARAAQPPRKCGARFSRKARIPSL